MTRFAYLIVLSFMVSWLPNLILAQTLSGQVLLGHQKTSPPFGGVIINVSGYTTQMSDQDLGTFEFIMLDKKPGAKISIEVAKDGFAVINREALTPYLPLNPQDKTIIHMALEEERDELALKFYELAYMLTVEPFLEEAREKLMKKGDANGLLRLELQREELLSKADAYAKFWANYDPANQIDMPLENLLLHQQGLKTEKLGTLEFQRQIDQMLQATQQIEDIQGFR